MESSFSIVQSKSDGELTLQFSGPIDENTNLPDIDHALFKKVVIDLKNVTLLNSAGLRGWVYWMQNFPVRTQVILRHCTKFIVYQMNVLDGFVPMGAQIESIFVPYYCDNCGHEEDVLAVRGKDFMEASRDRPAENYVAENIPCPKCQSVMEMSFFSSKYFRFLDNR